MDHTPEQQFAINYEDSAAIVSAAAGSGKTSVLAARVLRIIKDRNNGINADEMVVSTFTNEAAAELRSRIVDMVGQEIADAEQNNDKELCKYLTDQRLRLADAHICTISSFCLDILRRSSAEAGLQPGFSVIDSSEGDLMYARAVKTVLEDYCESGDPVRRDMMYDWFFGEDDRELEKAITTLYRFSRNLPDRKNYFRDQIAIYDDPDKMSPQSMAQLEKYVKKHIVDVFAGIRAVIPDLTEIADRAQATKYAAKVAGVAELTAGITDMASCLSSYDTVMNAKFPVFRRDNNDKEFESANGELLEELKVIRESIREEWKNALTYMKVLKFRNADMKKCKPVLEELVRLMFMVERRFDALKRERNAVDFSDIELMTIDLLRDENGGQTEFAKELSKSLKVIIVDEFQDSNDIQYEIFRLLSQDKKNLFFVGDIKQSIYQFRGANPIVFQRLTKDPDFRVIDLNKNFRSCDEVIVSVNMIFTGTMTEELGDVNYDSKCALVRGSTAYSTDKELNRTEFITFEGGSQPENRRREAEYIAWRIKTMYGEGFKVTEKNGDKRQCGYGDFAVIMGRYNSNIDIYKSALEKAGIPCEAKENEDYTGKTEIKLAMAMLKVIDDPYRSTELAAVLMNEPFMFDAEEMARIKLESDAAGSKALWTGLVKRAKSDAHAAAAVSEIRRYRTYAAENSAERLIRMICDESLLMPVIQASPNGERRSFNLRKLIYYAEMFAESGCLGLGDFIANMDDLAAGKVKLPSAKGGNKSGVVRLMSIHGSKGLEFPICFVSNLFSRPISENGDVICNSEYGIGMKINDRKTMTKTETAAYSMTLNEIRRRADSENMRLLYVAATRAREKLIFTAPYDGKKPDQHYGWLLGSAAVNEKDPAHSMIRLERVKDNRYSLSGQEIDEDDRQVAVPHYREYAYREYLVPPAKVTATQVGVKSVDDFSEESSVMDRFLRMPTFAAKERETAKLSPKKRGDAYHKVMELLDFRMAPEDLPAVLDRLHSDGVLSDAERITVDEKDIARFLESDLCRRAAASERVEREYPLFCEYSPKPGEWGIEKWNDDVKPFVQGVADMFFVEDGEIVLVDYKTNRGKTADELREEYSGQLAVYAHALSEATGMKVRQKVLFAFEIGTIEVE